MLKITLLSVGRIKEDYYAKAVAEYIKRLSRFCVTEEIVQNELAGENNLEKEADKLLPLLKGKVIVMDKSGEKLSSEELAKKLENISLTSPQITFVIGSSCGLSPRVKKAADYQISFSDMTLPHSLAKVLLCEQLYRAFCINSGSKYHK